MYFLDIQLIVSTSDRNYCVSNYSLIYHPL
nr:MAG TPA: hypothetical protein [Caudoviricetes sp.]DAN66380.1 MAG TPA: hypothetical protein [Caudoviricetes sp.]DAW50941.1 MAG TPA: hypothetical protein [Caudoviricetes sp.]